MRVGCGYFWQLAFKYHAPQMVGFLSLSIYAQQLLLPRTWKARGKTGDSNSLPMLVASLAPLAVSSKCNNSSREEKIKSPLKSLGETRQAVREVLTPSHTCKNTRAAQFRHFKPLGNHGLCLSPPHSALTREDLLHIMLKL